MISYKHRFHGHGSLRYVLAHGRVARSRSITIKYIANPRRKQSRAAVIVSKKVYKGAVGRNRIRRRLYEYMRNRLGALPPATDIALIVTSPEVRTLPAAELEATLDQLLTQAGLYSDSDKTAIMLKDIDA